MILRRYGNSYQSVDLNFDSRALTEIGFRRNQSHSEPVDGFDDRWARVATHELTAEAEGDVHDHVEAAALDELEAQLQSIMDGLGEGEIVVIDSEQGVDYPKTRADQKTINVKGENRLHFTVRIEPPLTVGVVRSR